MVSGDGFKKELSDYVGVNLLNLVCRGDFQVHPAVATDSFLQAFENNGFGIDIGNERSKFYAGKTYAYSPFSVSADHEKILKGLSNDKSGSIAGLSESAKFIYKTLLGNRREIVVGPGAQDKDRLRSVFDDFTFYLSDYFKEHHENALLSDSGEVPDLKNPEIFEEVYKDIPEDIYKEVMHNRSRGKRSFKVAPPQCLMEDFREFLDVDRHFPDELSLADYMMGNYFDKLSEKKGFKTHYDSSDRLLGFLKEGIGAFRKVY